MSQQCTWSSTFSNLACYKGFFPSYVDDQLDFSADFSTGEMSDRFADLAEAPSDQGTVESSLAQHAGKQSRKIGPELTEGPGSSSSGSVSSGGGGNARNTGTRRRMLRKANTPRRSARRNDPRFRGVTFCVETQICQQNRQRFQLLIRSFYSMKKRHSNDSERGQAKMKRQKMSLVASTSSSGSDEAEAVVPQTVAQHIAVPCAGIAHGGKQCASCLTRHTPLWRDAEDGTPLCNACGIRYKKYRIRCTACWNIPKKDGKSSCRVCSRCGNTLRFTIPKRTYLF
ncbi:GATA-type zinc finger protein 1-like [Acanthaster planci]|uniref:GATA-type zinc finger protein 1-like n=1 Tax=Acanthaster planci TaxID=133434 RepID=A0A8B7ZIV2_ACAPL|nr:GATA-type zinc finger protein 1-like [Acanthaster planci]